MSFKLARRKQLFQHCSFPCNALNSLRRFQNLSTRTRETTHCDNMDDGVVTVTPKSNRQQFREITPHPSILSYVQKVGVGIPQRAKRRKRSMMNPNTLVSSASSAWDRENTTIDRAPPPPPPFGPGSKVRLVASCDVASQFPTSKYPEIAFVGRSNCGKSTLLNTVLYGNKSSPGLGKGPGKAVMSTRPGETRQVSFYHLSSACSTTHIRLIDLPGYGFAHGMTATTEKEDESSSSELSFQTLMKDYILYRGKCLKRVLLLVDARHGLKRMDVLFLTSLQETARQNASLRSTGMDLPALQVVLTKCDLVTQIDLARRVSLVRQQLSDCLRRESSHLPTMLVSARSALLSPTRTTTSNVVASTRRRDGILELQKELGSVALKSR